MTKDQMPQHKALEQVDMMTEARNAQWNVNEFMGRGALKVIAPAKVNLVLGVGEKRQDGYHDVLTVMHALALRDDLFIYTRPVDEFEAADAVAHLTSVQALAGPADNLLVTLTMSDSTGLGALQVAPEENLAFQAVDALARAIHRDEPEIVKIHIKKNIPAEGGLGGGSADAAAALVGAATRWNLDASDERLHQVARSLGADVAFFLWGGCALLEGVGDAFVRSLKSSKESLVVVKPAGGVSTPAAYRAFDQGDYPIPDTVVENVAAAQSADEVRLFNNLALASEQQLPELATVREWLASQVGADQVLLCGSGASTFARTTSFAEASRLAAEATKQGWWARATSFSPLRCVVSPLRA